MPTAWWCSNSYWKLSTVWKGCYTLDGYQKCYMKVVRNIFIWPESDHWQCLSLPHSLPFCKLDWCDPGMWRWQLKICWSCYCYEKVVEVVNVANVDDEDRVGNSLLQILKLRFGHKARLLFRLWAQGLLVKILKLKFRRDFEAEVWSVFCCWCLVEVLKLNLSRYS